MEAPGGGYFFQLPELGIKTIEWEEPLHVGSGGELDRLVPPYPIIAEWNGALPERTYIFFFLDVSLY